MKVVSLDINMQVSQGGQRKHPFSFESNTIFDLGLNQENKWMVDIFSEHSMFVVDFPRKVHWLTTFDKNSWLCQVSKFVLCDKVWT